MQPPSVNRKQEADAVSAAPDLSRDPPVLGAPEIFQQVLSSSSPARQATISLNEKTSDAKDEFEDFDLEAKLHDYQRQSTLQDGHPKQKKLDVAWHDLYVRGVGANVQYGKTVGR